MFMVPLQPSRQLASLNSWPCILCCNMLRSPVHCSAVLCTIPSRARPHTHPHQTPGTPVNHCPGTLPPSWGALFKLQVCRLWNNTLSGPLPGSWSGMGALEDLALNINALTGGGRGIGCGVPWGPIQAFMRVAATSPLGACCCFLLCCLVFGEHCCNPLAAASKLYPCSCFDHSLSSNPCAVVVAACTAETPWNIACPG
jgi:hypothetical protein